ncbi:hypothetical protein K3N28_05275 [Glycomyces sp. TRM65418]|uniref:hypothetical protein n=1 Tax=Glycomyces sp. TRM65418 TaxID=2867006 RepID=UPI001CE6BE22|nr:hypothetical protein [Glycomyces sp. TRM65418]MCC3762479.1 hypothetical protein [Glycomyces sp. TRM65418]QZD56523.1 hypothetical protein K3N28_05235 [Glycomyces sp. TRM65418]
MAAPSYNLVTGAVVTAQEALDHFATSLGCPERHQSPASASGAELWVATAITTADEDRDTAAYMGMTEMLEATFVPHKSLDADAEELAISRAIGAIAEFLEVHPGPQAIVFDDIGFRILLRRFEDGQMKLDETLLDPENLNSGGSFNELARRYQAADLGHLEL